MRHFLQLLAAAAIFAAAPPAHATLLFYDDFNSPGATAGDDANDPTDTSWTGVGNLLVNPRGTFGPGESLYNQSGVQQRYLRGDLGPTVNIAAGQTLVFNSLIQTNNNGGLGSRADAYHFGLFDSNDAGYFIRVGSNGNNNFLLMRDDGANGNPGNGGATALVTSTLIGGGLDGTVHDFTIAVGHTLSGDAIITATINGQSLVFLDTTAPQLTFDNAVTGIGTHSIDWWQDNSAAMLVPEPSTTLGLMALLSTMLFGRRRRSVQSS